jgi:hypothetical protein
MTYEFKFKYSSQGEFLYDHSYSMEGIEDYLDDYGIVANYIRLKRKQNRQFN